MCSFRLVFAKLLAPQKPPLSLQHQLPLACDFQNLISLSKHYLMLRELLLLAQSPQADRIPADWRLDTGRIHSEDDHTVQTNQEGHHRSHTCSADLLLLAFVRMVHPDMYDVDQILVSHMASSVVDPVRVNRTGLAYQVDADEAVADPFPKVLKHAADQEAFAVAVDPEGYLDPTDAAAAVLAAAAVGRMIHRGWAAHLVAFAAEKVCLEMPHLQVVTRCRAAFVPTDQKGEAKSVDIEMAHFHLNVSVAALMLQGDQEGLIRLGEDAEMSPVGLFFRVLERCHPFLQLQETSPIEKAAVVVVVVAVAANLDTVDLFSLEMASFVLHTHQLTSVQTYERLDLLIVAAQANHRHSATSPIQEVAALVQSELDLQWVACPIQDLPFQLGWMAAAVVVSKTVPSPVQLATALPAEWLALTVGIRSRHWVLLLTLLEHPVQFSPFFPACLRTFHHTHRSQRHQVLAAQVALQCDSRICLHYHETQSAVGPQQILVQSLKVAETMPQLLEIPAPD